MIRSSSFWSKTGLLFVLSLLLGGFPTAAKAAFLFCNQTSAAIEAAFGHRDTGGWISQGWWQIKPGECARVYGSPITQRFYFYYARALTLPSAEGEKPRIWGGKYPFCIDKKAFKIEGDGNCEERHYRSQGFREIDVGTKKSDYTLTFEDLR